MGTGDECAQVIRCSVQMRRCKKIYPIITPAEFPRELCDWHHLDHRNPYACQLRQLLRRSEPCSLLRECADVHFVDDLAFYSRECGARPIRVLPSELPWIDYPRGPLLAFRL